MLASFQPNCRTVAIIMLVLAGFHFFVAIFHPRFLHKFRISWGRFGGGVRVSRLGFAGWGFAFSIIALAAILNGYGILSSSHVPFMLLAAFLVLAAAGFYDTYRQRHR
jgi:hypothetical protein